MGVGTNIEIYHTEKGGFDNIGWILVTARIKEKNQSKTAEMSPLQSGPPSLFIHGDSLCGPSPSSVQVSSCVSCPQLSSHCCFPPWYRGPGGELITTCTGCRHPELPTRSRDLPASWYMGSVFFGGGGVRLLFHCWIITCLFSHLTVINYKIFGKIKEKNMLCDSSLRIVFDNV